MNTTKPPPLTPPSTPPPPHHIPHLSTCKTPPQLKQLHAQLIKTGQINDLYTSSQLLKSASLSPTTRDLLYARRIFRHMHRPSVFSYNTIIRALAESAENPDDPLEGLAVFERMLYDEFVGPNMFTYPSVLKACARGGRIDVGEQVHGVLVKIGLVDDEFVLSNLLRMYVVCGDMRGAAVLFGTRVECGGENGGGKRREEGDVVLWNVMVDGYVRVGDFNIARKLFDEMPKRSVVSWNGLIAGYSKYGLFRDAVDVFREMQVVDESVKPNYVTLVSVLPAVAHLGVLELGKWVHLYADRNGIVIDDVLGSAFIDMYSKCGSVDKALQVFKGLPKNSTITWNAIINGLALHGRADEAIQYFYQMQEVGVKPSDVTYIAVLTACSHGGKVSEGRMLFDHMAKVSGFQPRIEHYGCMVDLLGRKGLLKDAEKLILDMPMEPDDVIWKALLGACKMHGDIEMGRRVAKHLMEMAPTDSGSYVALSNMYASLGDWDKVAQVRLLMKDRDIRKDPGCSWVELHGKIHEFLVEDGLHQHSKEIQLMLKEISEKLCSIGYEPDTSQVMLNMDEEEKQSALHNHSEKIAVAFGLISTSPQTPLRIVKNLRICQDCHSSIKLISKLYKRKIIVRDRKRFHHFVDGICSCNDYW